MSEVSRAARLQQLRALLEEERHASQQELATALSHHGVQVSQSTLSKDLLALGAERRRAADGSLVYAIPPDGDFRAAAREKLARLCSELVQSLQSAQNQIVLKTPPGAAQYFAACLDAARLRGVIGTIAGDDTILVITTDPAGGPETAQRLLDLADDGTGERDPG